MRSERKARGFTLVEMLVVLVLTGAIVAILTQALGQVFRLQSHFGAELFNTQQGEMYTEWFRQSVNGLLPDHPDGPEKFKGAEKEFQGLTLAPLDTSSEALQAFAWSLAFDPKSGETQLQYSSGEKAVVVLSWPGNSGRFVYVDEKDETHDAWPPFSGRWPQLPKAINLEYRDTDGPRVIVAVPKGPHNALPRRKDTED